jgi:hypothetical protein
MLFDGDEINFFISKDNAFSLMMKNKKDEVFL